MYVCMYIGGLGKQPGMGDDQAVAAGTHGGECVVEERHEVQVVRGGVGGGAEGAGQPAVVQVP